MSAPPRVLLLVVLACAHTPEAPRRIANLQRAAALPWTDEGRCVVREAANEWSVLAERCYHALDLQRVQFRDVEGRCPVAALVLVPVGICLLAAVEFAAGVVVVTGTFLVAGDLAVELGFIGHGVRERQVVRPPVLAPAPRATPRPVPGPNSRDWFPPPPPTTSPRPDEEKCRPLEVSPRGGHDRHNTCADKVPGNAFPGANVLLNGKAFDALSEVQTSPGIGAFVLWEVKTTELERYGDFPFDVEYARQLAELRNEQKLAWACGYRFAVGVVSEFHKQLLEESIPTLRDSVIVMWWC